jgi:hypothetical protein
MTTNAENKFICYLDILGFKQRVSEDDFKHQYEDLISKVIEPYSYPDKVYFLSDSIIIISKDFRDAIDNIFSIYSMALNKGVLIRGGLTRGQVDTPGNIQESGNRVIIPYLGKAFIDAYNLEQSINSAAICVDNNIFKELREEEKSLFIKYKEIFSKEGKDYEKIFLVRDMNNPSVPATMLTKISEQVRDIRKHDIPKFINTFCLYFKVLKDDEKKYNTQLNYNLIFKDWDNILENLLKIE